MVQAVPKLITFDEFITQFGDNERYELIDGELFDMEPTGPHEQVAGLINRKLNVEIDRLDLPYFIPKFPVVSHNLVDSGNLWKQ